MGEGSENGTSSAKCAIGRHHSESNHITAVQRQCQGNLIWEIPDVLIRLEKTFGKELVGRGGGGRQNGVKFMYPKKQFLFENFEIFELRGSP